MTDEKLLESVFYDALALAGVTDFFVKAEFREFAGLNAKASADREKGVFSASVSNGFACAPRDALTGLALELVSKCFRKKPRPATAVYSRALKEFLSRETTASLGESLKMMHGRRRKKITGRHHDLDVLLNSVVAGYPAVFGGVKAPEITWSAKGGRRRLAFHDPAMEQIVVNRRFDSPRVPDYVVKYLVFHELLHAKHDVLYARGKSLRRTIHPRAFKGDEKKFGEYGEAQEWLEKFA